MFSLPAPYWFSIGLVLAGLIVLALILLRALRTVRAARTLVDASNAVFSNELGLLRARRAALGVSVRERRARRGR